MNDKNMNYLTVAISEKLNSQDLDLVLDNVYNLLDSKGITENDLGTLSYYDINNLVKKYKCIK